MDREQILAEVRRTARENDRRPLGRARFAEATGVTETVWSRYWTRWSEVCVEAGFIPNSRPGKVPEEVLLRHLASLALSLGSFPVNNEIRMARRKDPEFPSHNTISRLGSKATIAARLLEFCEANTEYEDVAAICRDVVASIGQAEDEEEEQRADKESGLRSGYVYLMRSGAHFKIGLSAAPGRREYELAIQMPEKVELIHQISTDDMDGIETYWHRRFADQRANGEWFKLSTSDIRAFKSRKSM